LLKKKNEGIYKCLINSEIPNVLLDLIRKYDTFTNLHSLIYKIFNDIIISEYSNLISKVFFFESNSNKIVCERL